MFERKNKPEMFLNEELNYLPKKTNFKELLERKLSNCVTKIPLLTVILWIQYIQDASPNTKRHSQNTLGFSVCPSCYYLFLKAFYNVSVLRDTCLVFKWKDFQPWKVKWKSVNRPPGKRTCKPNTQPSIKGEHRKHSQGTSHHAYSAYRLLP